MFRVSAANFPKATQPVSDETFPSLTDLHDDFSMQDSFPDDVSKASQVYNNHCISKGDYTDCVVREVRWYKKKSGPQPEYLIITAEVAPKSKEQSPKKVYFRLDRTYRCARPPKEMQPSQVITEEMLQSPEWAEWEGEAWPTMKRKLQRDYEDRRLDRLKLQMAPVSLNNRLSELSSHASSAYLCLSNSVVPFTTVDTIRRLPDASAPSWPKRHWHLFTLTFSETPASRQLELSDQAHPPPKPYFRVILFSLTVVSRTKPQYDVLLYQCYW
ncbi:hypothetical protein CVT24_006251 [Panaeolus cyanescens]|uniref:Uncharacterized protein n=1 Tax=Panaeolus cyanescens TaxID=181874 RepID=A0A409YEH9_9AGAR|nr:hypothetical protein CVT24_006251 [Panaeolus cyanescens]